MWLKEEDSEIQGSLAQKPLGRTQKTINEKKQLKSGPVLDTCSKSVKSCLPVFNSLRVFPFFNFYFLPQDREELFSWDRSAPTTGSFPLEDVPEAVRVL